MMILMMMIKRNQKITKPKITKPEITKPEITKPKITEITNILMI